MKNKSLLVVGIVIMFVLTGLTTVAVGKIASNNINSKDKNFNIDNGINSVSNKCAYSGKGSNLEHGYTIGPIDFSDYSQGVFRFRTKFEIVGDSSAFVCVNPNNYNIFITHPKSLKGYEPDWIDVEINLDDYIAHYKNHIGSSGIDGSFSFSFFHKTSNTDEDHWLRAEGMYVDEIVVEGDGIVLYSEDFEDYDIGDELFGHYNVLRYNEKGWTVVEEPISFAPHKSELYGPFTSWAGIEPRKLIKCYFNARSIDPDGDQVYYWFDWGDGTNSGWLGPYESGERISAEHRWMEGGIYEVKVKAKDVYDVESSWAIRSGVNVSKNKATNTFFYEVFGEVSTIPTTLKSLKQLFSLFFESNVIRSFADFYLWNY